MIHLTIPVLRASLGHALRELRVALGPQDVLVHGILLFLQLLDSVFHEQFLNITVGKLHIDNYLFLPLLQH